MACVFDKRALCVHHTVLPFATAIRFRFGIKQIEFWISVRGLNPARRAIVYACVRLEIKLLQPGA